MATLVKQIHDLVDIAIDKGVTGYLSRTQIDTQIHAVQMDMFRLLLKEYPLTERSRNYLSPFEVPVVVALTAGSGDKPAGFQHEIVVTLNDADNSEVEIVEEGQWAFRLKDPIDPPSITRPVCIIRKATIDARPIVISQIRLVYFRKPVKPVYGTQETNGQLLYDEASTTD